MFDYICNGGMKNYQPEEEEEVDTDIETTTTTSTVQKQLQRLNVNTTRRTTKSLSSVYESVRNQKKQLLTDRIVLYQSKGWLSQQEFRKYTMELAASNINDENTNDVNNKIGNLNPYRELELELDLLEDRYNNNNNNNSSNNKNNNNNDGSMRSKTSWMSSSTTKASVPPRRASKGLTPKGSGIGRPGTGFERNHPETTTALLSPPLMRLRPTAATSIDTTTGRFVSTIRPAPPALAVPTSRVVHELKGGRPSGGIPSIVDPSDLVHVISESQISELFVEMCFFARLGFVQPPCCLQCTYKEATSTNKASSSSSKMVVPNMNCKRWVIWRKDVKKPYNPDHFVDSSSVVVVQCNVARKLLAGETVGDGWKWDRVNKTLVMPPSLRRRNQHNIKTGNYDHRTFR